MDLVSFYDRTSGFQFVAWAGLFILALAGVALTIERAIKLSRAGRQTKLFLSLANEALTYERPSEALRLARHLISSPVAFVVNASVVMLQSGEFRFSSAARHVATTAKATEIMQGLAMLGAIAMTTPMIAAAASVEGLIRYLRFSSIIPFSSDVLQNWVADWLICLLAGWVLAFFAIWAHRLLSAKANRLLLEMDRLSLAIVCRIMTPTEGPPLMPQLLSPETSEIASLDTQPIDIRSRLRHHTAP